MAESSKLEIDRLFKEINQDWWTKKIIDVEKKNKLKKLILVSGDEDLRKQFDKTFQMIEEQNLADFLHLKLTPEEERIYEENLWRIIEGAEEKCSNS